VALLLVIYTFLQLILGGQQILLGKRNSKIDMGGWISKIMDHHIQEYFVVFQLSFCFI